MDELKQVMKKSLQLQKKHMQMNLLFNYQKLMKRLLVNGELSSLEDNGKE